MCTKQILKVRYDIHIILFCFGEKYKAHFAMRVKDVSENWINFTVFALKVYRTFVKMAGMDMDDTENIMTLEKFQLCNQIYAEKRRLWKITAPEDLLHHDADCGNCWLAKQEILYFNPEIYVYDGVTPKISHDKLVEMYEMNVEIVRNCGCRV